MFAFGMFVTHAHLVLLNITTVEQMRMRDMKEHESAMLAERYSMCAFYKKRQVRARWDEEWGKPTVEGNIWWLGSRRRNWESVMGQSVWTWFCKWWQPDCTTSQLNSFFKRQVPVGKAENDGTNYPINPRFDAQGRWRKRAEWPVHLR